MAGDFVLPDLGEGIHEAQIIQVLIKEGDEVSADQPLMEVETDKAAVEIPSPEAGKIAKVHVEAGQTVIVGAPLVTFGENGATAAAVEAPAPSKAPVPSKAPAPIATPPPAPSTPPAAAEPAPAKTGRPAKVAASPAVRRIAKERGIDLASIKGSGPGGRVTRDDIEQAGSGTTALPTAPGTTPTAPSSSGAGQVSEVQPDSDLPDFGKWGPIRRESISQVRKAIARQMVRSEALNVHVTHNDSADIQELEDLRREHNARRREEDPKLTLLAFVMKAVHAAMRSYPQFNASFDHSRNEIIFKDYFHFGIAVDTPRGLIVPVIRDVDKKSIRQLAVELIELGEKARQASFAIEELRGGSFTITNIGSLGGIVSTPIINYPEVAILGLGKARQTPVVRDDKIVARLMMPLNLSFDHRIVDGADAARFCSEVMRYLEVPGRLLLEV